VQDPIVIVSGARTPIGRYAGSLSHVEAHVLGATAVSAALDRAALDHADGVDEVVMGCIAQMGPDSYNARRVTLAAGLPDDTPAFNVNRLCGSGLQAIISGAMELQAGHGSVIVAGGNESMSRVPFLVPEARAGHALGDRALIDGTVAILTDPWSGKHMGVTAENVAREYGITRADQDSWALLSQQRAAAAVAEGRFERQIAPVAVPDRRGAVAQVTADEHPRPDTSANGLATLRPAFDREGTVTAGNSSGINDGGAAVVLMRESEARAVGRDPLARLVDWASAAMDPQLMGVAPIIAVRRVLNRTALTMADIDIVELNEAFAAQVVAVMRETGMTHEQVNPLGGAIALGHPVGATGAILTVKLVHALQDLDAERGLVTMCIGGGQALAAVFERCS